MIQDLEMPTGVQSVSNMEGLDPTVRFLDTIAPCSFFVKAFRYKQYPTSHYGRIHGIVGAVTLNGDTINEDSITDFNSSPWLVHDWQRIRPNAAGVDTRVAWSAGCLVIPDKSLELTGSFFDKYNVQIGQKIPAMLVMES